MTRTYLFAVSALALATLAAACDDDGEETAPAGQSVGEQLCSSVQEYLASCGAATPCDEALVADCADLVGILNESLLQATLDCMGNGGSPMSCLVGSVTALQPSEAHLALAQKACDVCTGGLGVDTCKELFFSDTSDLQLGVVLLPFGDEVVNKVGTDCVTDLLSCGSLLSCAQTTLVSQALPEATAQCLVDNLSNPGAVTAPDCGGGGGGPGSGGGGDGGSGGSASGCDPVGSWMMMETSVASDCAEMPPATDFTLVVTPQGGDHDFVVNYGTSYPCAGTSNTEGGACGATFSCDFPYGQGLFNVDFTESSVSGTEVWHLTDLMPPCFAQYDVTGTRQ